jgi:hypothetical protein
LMPLWMPGGWRASTNRYREADLRGSMARSETGRQHAFFIAALYVMDHLYYTRYSIIFFMSVAEATIIL